MIVENIIPDDFVSVQLTIPPRTPDFIQYFTTSLDFSKPSMRYCTTHAHIIIDTSRIYNVQTTEMVTRTPGSAVTFSPGYYDIATLSSLLSVSIPLVGANAYKCINTSASVLNLSAAPSIKQILGYSNDVININDVPENVVDVTLGYDTAFFSCDLTNLASLISLIYVDIVAVSPAQTGKVLYDDAALMIPLLRKNPSSIRWWVYNRYGKLYNINTPITIHIDITGWKMQN